MSILFGLDKLKKYYIQRNLKKQNHACERYALGGFETCSRNRTTDYPTDSRFDIILSMNLRQSESTSWKNSITLDYLLKIRLHARCIKIIRYNY